MRLLKQSVLSAMLVLVVMVSLNLMRIGRVPAEGRGAGEGQLAARSGDTNCDGKIDITDPIIVLNWLFSDGPEPCAMAQTDTCCADLRGEIASLRAAVESLSARIVGPRDIFFHRGKFSFPANGGQAVAYKVPEDKWLILTFVRFGDARPALLKKVNGSSQELKLPGSDADADWLSGFPIPPGTELVVSHPQPYFNPPGPFEVEFYFHGYLAAE